MNSDRFPPKKSAAVGLPGSAGVGMHFMPTRGEESSWASFFSPVLAHGCNLQKRLSSPFQTMTTQDLNMTFSAIQNCLGGDRSLLHQYQEEILQKTAVFSEEQVQMPFFIEGSSFEKWINPAAFEEIGIKAAASSVDQGLNFKNPNDASTKFGVLKNCLNQMIYTKCGGTAVGNCMAERAQSALPSLCKKRFLGTSKNCGEFNVLSFTFSNWGSSDHCDTMRLGEGLPFFSEDQNNVGLKLATKGSDLHSATCETDPMHPLLWRETTGCPTPGDKNNADSTWSLPEIKPAQKQGSFVQPLGGIAVLTPDQDNGYCSLEEERFSDKLHMDANTKGSPIADREFGGSTCDQPEQSAHGVKPPDTGFIVSCSETQMQGMKDSVFTSCSGEENPGETKVEGLPRVFSEFDVSSEGGDSSDDSDSGDEEDSDSERCFPVLSKPVCQNKTIAYILGDTSSEEDGEESSDSEDDDGFDSDSSSDVSDSENIYLLNFTRSQDPYNLQNFTAKIYTASDKRDESKQDVVLLEEYDHNDSSGSKSPSLCASPSPQVEDEDREECDLDEPVNIKLWNSFNSCKDPYNPFNFKAPLQTSKIKKKSSDLDRKVSSGSQRVQCCVSLITEESSSEWFDDCQDEPLSRKRDVTPKKVLFLDEVTEYYLSDEEDRKGPWEAFARDRCRFKKRIQEIEEAVAYCLAPEHRRKVAQRLRRDC
ncbi:protein phosphatase 1 regulatory subunit 15B [Latimeria chalumnae]|uniref:Protein phosphatase 1 regulatory subunit 15B n=1 Tax=Latimeria chalumnae TaxID=7897 RepID=M3XK44_LATCH|nr:PREDICTED: protein phosphatase 1 regulatory subunit 15B [Latimeria chalumnae]|eukprot:XP_005989282.1 PREDICTED: protein phosphatase 1 regulatory subunit 15B [Latimeria chalumnae]